jgi:hypothetical protein
MAEQPQKNRLGGSFLDAFRRELEAVAYRRDVVAADKPLPRAHLDHAGQLTPLQWPGTPAQPKSSPATAAKSPTAVKLTRSAGDPPLEKQPARSLPAFDAGAFRLHEKAAMPPAISLKSAATPLRVAQETEWKPGDPVTGADRLNLTGISLSGGGIRSAAVCMGVLQGLDALSPEGSSQVLDRLDYMSTVSGGNYMGTSVASGMLQTGGAFPYESKTDQSETPETQHLRDYSSYLMPNGWIDYFGVAFVYLRGLIANLAMILPIILSLALLTIAINPTFGSLGKADVLGFSGGWLDVWPEGLGTFVVTPLLASLVLLWMLYWTARKSYFMRDQWNPLSVRENAGIAFGVVLLAVVVLAFVEWQPTILKSMFLLPSKSAAAAGDQDGLTTLVGWVVSGLGQVGAVVGSIILALIALTQKLLNTFKATLGDNSRSGALKRAASKFGLVVVGLVIPLLLWTLYLNLSYWGVSGRGGLMDYGHAPYVLQGAASWLADHAPEFIATAFWLKPAIGPVGVVYFWLALILLGVVMMFSPNASSLNAFYRDRLARAFLTERQALLEGRPSADVDTWRFSSLKEAVGAERPISEQGGLGFVGKAASCSPYLLVNTAINIQGSRLLNQRGRNADVFTLGPLVSGSDATGFVPTIALENADPNLTMATGMAISGAAASANMGGNTIPALTFSLAMLNVRLGYWLNNPALMTRLPKQDAYERGIGVWWFLRELFGNIKERSARIYLTDGGHIENLGLYELLKRRCRVIIVVDAEADQGMVFPSYVKAQLLSRIDHGVTIQMPWAEIAKVTQAASKAMGTPEESSIAECSGPHVAIGRIKYRRASERAGSLDVHGVLIYIKSSLSGDENDLIRDYKRRHADFPHETTLDQFFSEEQFEVYRALGFHIAHGFFRGTSDAAFWTPRDRVEALGFLEEVRNALISIGVPPKAIDAIIARALAKMDSDLTKAKL